MMFYILFVLTFNSSVFSAMVRELPSIFKENETEIENNTTEVEEITAVTTLVTEALDHIIDMSEEMNITLPETNITWNTEASPLLSALRSFWTQARSGLLEPIDTFSDEPDHKNEQIFKAIEHGLIEATTMLISQIEETTASTLPSNNVMKEISHSVKRTGDIPEPKERINLNIKTKRKGSFEMAKNISTSCSSCYESLQSCIQKCFVSNNCHDVQRSVRACPPVPSRLCNPFTQWNPVDECESHSDCKSPLLCCNDGCVNKCLPGEWRS